MIADRVVLGRLAPRALGWLGVVVAVYAIADLADALRAPVPWTRLPLRLPAMLFQGLPIALAAAVAHTVSSLRRSGEWTGLAAAGVSTTRRVASVALVCAAAAVVAWVVGDGIAPAASVAYRSAGGGPPPGAVVLPLPAANWTHEGRSLHRAGPAPLRVRFGDGLGPPSIDAATPGETTEAHPMLPPATDVPRAGLLRLARRAGDALPYALEAAFRPLVAATSLLLPLLILAAVAPRAMGPRAAALATSLFCLLGYAIVAGAFALAAAGTVPPTAAAAASAAILAAITLVAAALPRRS